MKETNYLEEIDEISCHLCSSIRSLILTALVYVMAFNFYMKENTQKHFLSLIYLAGCCIVLFLTKDMGAHSVFFALVILFVVGKIFYVAGDLLRYRKLSVERAKRLFGTTILAIGILLFLIFEKVTRLSFGKETWVSSLLIPLVFVGIAFLAISFTKFVLVNMNIKKAMEAAKNMEKSFLDSTGKKEPVKDEDIIIGGEEEKKEPEEVVEEMLKVARETSNRAGHLPMNSL